MTIQDSINSWGNLLIATGGVLQPAKCFYSIISFEWINREWHYAINANRKEFGISVPLLGGSNARISHKPVNHAEKTLGAMTSLDGNSCAAVCMMQEKAQQWIMLSGMDIFIFRMYGSYLKSNSSLVSVMAFAAPQPPSKIWNRHCIISTIRFFCWAGLFTQ